MTHIEIFSKIHHLIGTPYVTTVKAYINELTGYTVSGPRLQRPDTLEMRYKTVDIITCNEGRILWFRIFQ